MRLMMSFIILLMIIPPSQGDEISDSCIINLSWGHGGAGNVWQRHRLLNVKGRSIYQGCGVGGSGDIKYQVWQTGYNGDWMGESSLIDNGGFNPVMSAGAREVLSRYSNVNDKKQLKVAEGEYVDAENSWAQTLSKQTGVSDVELTEGIISSGFARLTQYHWASLIVEAENLIQSKACSKVSINFICHDETYSYIDEFGQNITSQDLGNSTYQQRISQGSFQTMNIDKSLLKDSMGNSAVFENRVCLDIPGTKIEAVPKQCNESHVVDANIISQYRSGACGKFLSHVTSRFKGNRKLAGRSEIFSSSRNQTVANPASDSSVRQ